MSVKDPTRTAKKRIALGSGLYVRPKDGKFEHLYSENGRQHIVTLKARTKGDARNEIAERITKQRRGELAAPSKMTVSEMAADYFETFARKVASGERSERTLAVNRQRYRTHIDPHLGRVRVQNIQKRDVLRYLTALDETRIERGPKGKTRSMPLSPNTKRGVYTTLSAIFRHGLKQDVITQSPLGRVDAEEKPKPRNLTEPRILSNDERDSLISAAIPSYRPIISLVAFTALRINEALGLSWEDVDFDGKEIHVRFQLSRGTKDSRPHRVKLKSRGSEREVPLLPQLEAILKDHRAEMLALGRYQRDGLVFRTPLSGEPFSYHNVLKRGFHTAGSRAGLNRESLSPITPHDLRHTCITAAIAGGMNVYSVSRLAGHASPDITLRVYTHAFAKAEAAERNRGLLAAALGG